jgi:hypothetical protein
MRRKGKLPAPQCKGAIGSYIMKFQSSLFREAAPVANHGWGQTSIGQDGWNGKMDV